MTEMGMTESEALLRIKDMEYECMNSTIHYYTDKDIPMLRLSEKALEEIQQYRAIGTIEEFKALKEKEERFDRNIRMFNEIGLEIRAKAIDEFAEKLKEKSTFLKSIENDYYGYVSEYEIDDVAEQLKAGGIDE